MDGSNIHDPITGNNFHIRTLNFLQLIFYDQHLKLSKQVNCKA